MKTIEKFMPSFFGAQTSTEDKSIPASKIRVYIARFEVYEVDRDNPIKFVGIQTLGEKPRGKKALDILKNHLIHMKDYE